MKFNSIVLFILIFLLSLSCTAQTPSDDSALSASTAKQIDDIFVEYDKKESPGLALAVVQKGKLSYIKGYGSANIEHEVKIDPRKTLFNIGSTSKQFTIFAILLLAEQNKLSLDDDVRKHIPELPDFGKVVTLRHLGHHTSGFRSELALMAIAGWSPGDVISRQQVLRVIGKQKELNFTPGEQSMYSNSGYTILSEVVERVSGKSFAEFTLENILQPLQMNDSFFIESRYTIVRNMAFSYGVNQNGPYKNPATEGYSGSTGLFTTAADLVKWANNYRNPKVGTKKTIDLMNTLGKLNSGETAGFAFGQFIETYRGLKHIQHGGGTAGYASYLGRFPEQDVSIMILGNSSSVNARALSLRVADVVLEGQFQEKEKETVRAFTVNAVELARYAGSYFNGTDTTVNISAGEGVLNYAIGGGPTVVLRPTAKDRFEMVGVGVPRTVDFRKTDSGYTVHVYSGKREEEKLLPYTPARYSTKELSRYVGTFFSPELGTTYVLSIAEGNLVVSHIRFGSINLQPIVADSFRGTSWRFSAVKFERDSSGTINGFRVNSMRAKNILFEKLR